MSRRPRRYSHHLGANSAIPRSKTTEPRPIKSPTRRVRRLSQGSVLGRDSLAEAGGVLPLTVPMKRIPASGQGLNETRSLCLVAQSFAQPFDGVIHSAVEIHESVGRPDPLPQLFASNHLAGPFQKNLKKLERLVLQLDLHSLLAQFSRAKINFEHTEANCPQLGWTAVSMEAYTPLARSDSLPPFFTASLAAPTRVPMSFPAGTWPDYNGTLALGIVSAAQAGKVHARYRGRNLRTDHDRIDPRHWPGSGCGNCRQGKYLREGASATNCLWGQFGVSPDLKLSNPSNATLFNVLREFSVQNMSMATPEGVEPPTLRSEV